MAAAVKSEVIYGGYVAATVSPFIVEAFVTAVGPGPFFDTLERFSLASSWFICCSRHSALQKPLSPLFQPKIASISLNDHINHVDSKDSRRISIQNSKESLESVLPWKKENGLYLLVHVNVTAGDEGAAAEAASAEVVRRPGEFIGMSSIVAWWEHEEKAVIEDGAWIFDLLRFCDGGASDVEEDLLLAGGSFDT